MPRPRSLLFAAIAGIGLVLLALAGFVEPVREGLRWVFLPVVRVTSAAGSAVGGALGTGERARTANERADEADARLRAIAVDYVQLRALEEENKSLRAQAHFLGESGLQSLGARVIARAMRDQTAAVTIDRGSSDGVELGQAVVTPGWNRSGQFSKSS